MASGEFFSSAQRAEIDRAIRAAETASRFEFSVYVGHCDGESRPFAERLHAALGTHDMATLAGWLSDPACDADRRALAEALGAPPDAENVHAFLAATPCAVMLLQPEDALGVAEAWNVPGTTVEHPNWRRKLPLAVEDFGASERLERAVQELHGSLKSIPHAERHEIMRMAADGLPKTA